MSRPFNDVLRLINSGAFHDELTDAMSEAVAAAVSTGNKAELVIKLGIKPAKGSKEQVTVTHDLKVKMPEFARPDDHLFVVNGNSLSTKHPRQGEQPIAAVTRPIGEIVAPAKTA